MATSQTEQEVARLYALPPEEFIKARDEAARSADDKQIAAALKSLRKPSKAAALANLLAREDPKSSAALVDLGAALRQAQQDLDGDQLRTLSRQRRELVQGLRAKVRSLSSESVSDAIGRQLEDIFQSVLADPAAASAFAGARISGIPEGDDTDPFAGLLSARSTARPKKATTARKEPQKKDRDAVKEARAAERDAAAAARSAQADAKKLRTRVSDRAAAIEDLEDRLTRSRSELSALRKELRGAEHSAEVAERKLDELRAKVAKLSAG